MAKKRINVIDLREARETLRRDTEAMLREDREATPGSPDWWLGDDVWEDFLPVALIAEIPPCNVEAFLDQVASGYFLEFKHSSEKDSIRRDRQFAVHKLMLATRNMLAAIEYLERQIKINPSDDAKADKTLGFYLSGRMDLGALHSELARLYGSVKSLSANELPKRGESRSRTLLKNIWHCAEKKYGGKLTYYKHGNGGKGAGTLTEIIEFFSDLSGWVTPSPDVLDRLRPR
jgi:hypothetical protein